MHRIKSARIESTQMASNQKQIKLDQQEPHGINSSYHESNQTQPDHSEANQIASIYTTWDEMTSNNIESIQIESTHTHIKSHQI